MAACITDAAYISAAGRQASAIVNQAVIDAAIQVGVALYQRNASGSIVNMQEEIADRNTRLAERVQAHAELFWPEERELVDDIFSEGRHTEDYLNASNILGQYATDALSAGRTDWINTARELCMPPGRCEDARWQRNSEAIRGDLISYSLRQEESRVQVLNDRRYAWQLAMTNLGRGQLTALLSYQQINGSVAGNLGNIVEGSINSALQAYGYYSYRPEPRGWGVGMTDTWNLPRMPPPVIARPTSAAPSAPILPVAAVREPTSKLSEIEEGFQIADQMERERRNGGM
jgi:hypothetical protein